MFDENYIELDQNALEHNIRLIKNWVGENVQFSSVVKGNAYGHGLDRFIPMALKCGVNHFSVFSAKEAYSIAGLLNEDHSIMIMGMIEGDALAWAIEHGIEFYIFDIERLKNTIALAKKIKKPALVHIELETGMNRTGLKNNEISDVLSLIRDHSDIINLKGICTHLAGAESITNYHRVKSQRDKFKRYLKKHS